MCGLVAIVGKWGSGFSKPSMDIFHDLLFVDSLRGEDSTGMFVVERDGDVSIAKEASHSYQFQSSKEYKDLMNLGYRNGRFAVGHNRKATKGDITDDNAHPFQVDDKIVLVHNGTLWGDHKTLAETEVDSHAIAHVLAENPEDIQQAMSKINGAYALIWYDVEKEKLHFLRNSQRPLCYVETENAWVFSSEPSMLAFALNHNNVLPKGKIETLAENTLSTFHWDGKVMDVVNTKINPYVAPVLPSTGSWTPRRSGAGNLMEDDNLWKFGEENFREGLRTGAGMIPLRQVHTREQPINDYTSSGAGRAVIEEEKIAKERACIMSRRRLGQVQQAYPKGMVVDITCHDTVYVNGKNDDAGSFIYGTLDEDPYILVKIHLEKGTDEYEILDWTLNNKAAQATVNSVVYRPYSGTYQGSLTGFAMIYAGNFQSPKIVKQPVPDTFATSTIHLGEN